MRMTDNFTIDVDRDNSDFVSRLNVEATFNQDCTSLSIDKITDKDNSFREVAESELSLQELQQVLAGVTKQVIKRYNMYAGSL